MIRAGKASLESDMAPIFQRSGLDQRVLESTVVKLFEPVSGVSPGDAKTVADVPNGRLVRGPVGRAGELRGGSKRSTTEYTRGTIDDAANS
jgi:hypothetical protein